MRTGCARWRMRATARSWPIGFSYSDAVNAVAPDYPDINFAVVDGFDPDKTPNPNAAYLNFAANEGSFLVESRRRDDEERPDRVRRWSSRRPDPQLRGRLSLVRKR